MKILEFGEKSSPAVLLIHGMGCTGEKSFGTTVERLCGDKRVILPLLDGYDGGGTVFKSIEAQAAQLAEYLSRECPDGLFAVLGMSMGGFIALELLQKYPVKTERLILDSGYMCGMRPARFIANVATSCFTAIIQGRDGFIAHSIMRLAMGYCFRRDDICADASRETIFNSEFSCMTYSLPPLPGALANCDAEYWYGEKERHAIHGMKALKSGLPQLREVSMGSVGHGEVMFTQPQKYAELVCAALSRKTAATDAIHG